MNNTLYIVTDQCGQLIACSHEIINKHGLNANEIINRDEWFGNAGNGMVGREQRDIYIKEKLYLMSAYQLYPDHTIYILRPDTTPVKVAGGQVMISCAELNHKLRNPLTSMKIVADLLPHYLPAGSFRDCC